MTISPDSPDTAAAPDCHWELLDGPRRYGRSTRTLVWICEYPYRTILTGPSDDCDGCRRARSRMATGPHLDDDVQALEAAPYQR